MDRTTEAALNTYPKYLLDQDSISLYEGFLAHEMRFPKCQDCGKWHQPSRAVCPFCWSKNLKPVPVSGKGKVHLSVLLRQGPPSPGIEYPLPVVTVEFEDQESLRYSASITGVAQQDVKIGMPVEVDWVERGGAPYPIFRPRKSAAGV